MKHSELSRNSDPHNGYSVYPATDVAKCARSDVWLASTCHGVIAVGSIHTCINAVRADAILRRNLTPRNEQQT